MDKKTSQRQKRQPKGLEGNLWDCSVCTFSNTAEAFKCAMCDVRKGTSTRKPRLNPQLVAQQVAQHMTATATATPKPQQPPPQRREDSNSSKERKPVQSTLVNLDEKISKKKIRNIFKVAELESSTIMFGTAVFQICVPWLSVDVESTHLIPFEFSDDVESMYKQNMARITRETSVMQLYHRPRLKNVDRSQVHSQPVTVNNITVVITEYLPKPIPSSSSQAPSVTAAGDERSSGPVTNHSEIPNGIHIPPPKPS